MPRRDDARRELCAYRLMWLFAMFDLPVKSQTDRREYARFRKRLIHLGFSRLQFSVYARHCPNEENLDVHSLRVKAILPPKGEVRVMGVTDRQFSRMQSFVGEKRVPVEAEPLQLMLF